MNAQGQTVVVAEDEELTRLDAVEFLESAGYNVIEARHAAEALAALLVHDGKIHLLFTDIQMPGLMNGLELAHHVCRCWPQVAILIASGEFRPTTQDLPPGSRFLVKPYEPEHVLAHARELIAA